MEIKARCAFDFKSVRAVSLSAFYGKRDPKKTLIFSFIFFGLLALLCVLGMRSGLDIFHILIWIPVLNIVLGFFFYFVFPQIQFKGLHKMKQIENEYTFYDEHIRVLSRGEEYTGEAELRYTMIPKVMENSEYFFIYQSNNQLFVVDKSTVTGGSISELSEKLKSSVNGKYITCRY